MSIHMGADDYFDYIDYEDLRCPCGIPVTDDELQETDGSRCLFCYEEATKLLKDQENNI